MALLGSTLTPFLKYPDLLRLTVSNSLASASLVAWLGNTTSSSLCSVSIFDVVSRMVRPYDVDEQFQAACPVFHSLMAFAVSPGDMTSTTSSNQPD